MSPVLDLDSGFVGVILIYRVLDCSVSLMLQGSFLSTVRILRDILHHGAS